MRVVVTGGAGFIGSNLVHYLLSNQLAEVIVLDKLTYAGNLESLQDVADLPGYTFIHGDIGDEKLVDRMLEKFQPDAVMHLAAESHVDRSIDGPAAFVDTNINGTFHLLESVRRWWRGLDPKKQAAFRFHHISTDEVYGSLGETGLFSETTPYAPNSPYSASKAAADHLVRAYFHTYGLPTLITNCSNNYGPYHFPEKLIPLMILNALEEKPLPIYGTGQQIRDWLYVLDHCRALWTVVTQGKPGESYNIGGHNEKSNVTVVKTVCTLLDERRPRSGGKSYQDLITFVQDRPGHDLRYAIDADKIQRELGWKPQETFESGMVKTVEWYLSHPEWCRHITTGTYRRERLGLRE